MYYKEKSKEEKSKEEKQENQNKIYNFIKFYYIKKITYIYIK